MTVENTQNKMPPLQMGTTNEYPFNFAVLLQDPTAEEALEAIKASVLQADGTEVELVYNTDYTVTLNTDRIGGTLTVNNIRTSGDYITIYRQYAQTQEVDYKDFNSAPAETFEQCFDKLTMLSQQQQEEINRSLKFNVSSTIIDPSLPEPKANNTLIWDSVGSSLKNYDIIGENNQFKAEVNAAIIAGQADIQAQLDEFENVINSEIEDVREAAEKINELEQAVDDAQTAANSAEASASDASQAAISATQAAQNAQTTLNTRANIDLSNLSSVGENKFNTILNNKITNCLLEVPQRIKLELNNGTLTLKAGSEIILSGEEYKTYVTTEDQTFTFSGTAGGQFMVFVAATNGVIQTPLPLRDVASGDGAPTSAVTSSKYYDYTNRLFYYKKGGTSWVNWGVAYPIGIVTITEGVITSIDQIFNGMGYIGSTVWVDKGVKGLIPNGRNEDGSLINQERTTPRIVTHTIPSAWGKKSMEVVLNYNAGEVPKFEVLPTYRFTKNGVLNTAQGDTWTWTYYENDNKWFISGDSGATWYQVIAGFLGTLEFDGTKVTSFNPKKPFRAVDYNDFNVADYIAVDWSKKVNKTVSTTYTAESNGYVIAWGTPQGNNELNCTINGQSVFKLSFHGLSGVSYAQGFTLPVAKGDTYSVVGANGQYYFLPLKEV